MKTINEIRNITTTQEYDKHFWNAMRLKPDSDVICYERGIRNRPQKGELTHENKANRKRKNHSPL